MRYLKLFEQFNEQQKQDENPVPRMTIKKEPKSKETTDGTDADEIPTIVPRYIVDAYAELKKKDSSLSWWLGPTFDKGEKINVFVIEYKISATQIGHLLIYDVDKKKFKGFSETSTLDDIKKLSWEINYGTNNDRVRFFQSLQRGMQSNENRTSEN